MYVKINCEKYNVLFETTRVVERDDRIIFFSGKSGDTVHTELYFDKEPFEVKVYVMNDSGKTIDSWTIHPKED